MLNKPQGVVCANSDAEHPTVFDLIDTRTLHPSLRHQLQIAGRLDIDTTGLVLITSDGAWNHAITSPNKVLGKRYRVTTSDPISPEAPALFAQGLLLKQESKLTKPAKLTLLNSHHALLEITEGKYHQVKRMFAAIGNKVIALHREAIGTITLDTALAPSQFRPLTANERNLPTTTSKEAPCKTMP
jgi:16S rRNA pseudouridine516 synthase